MASSSLKHASHLFQSAISALRSSSSQLPIRLKCGFSPRFQVMAVSVQALPAKAAMVGSKELVLCELDFRLRQDPSHPGQPSFGTPSPSEIGPHPAGSLCRRSAYAIAGLVDDGEVPVAQPVSRRAALAK